MARLSGLEISDDPVSEGFEYQVDEPLYSLILYLFSIEPSFYDEIKKLCEEDD